MTSDAHCTFIEGIFVFIGLMCVVDWALP